jgi:hypothetical protein
MLTTVLAVFFALFSAFTFATVNIGNSRLAGPALVAGNASEVDLRDVDPGYIDCFRVRMNFTLCDTVNPGAGFAAVVLNGAAEGVDDTDRLLNAMYQNLSLYWESGNVAYNGLTPAQLRSMLIAMNRRDLEGNFVNGSLIPVHAAPAAFSITLSVPVSLRQFFDDGDVFGSGSHRMESGRFEFFSAATLTPTVVLANGSADVGGQSITISVQYGDGDASDMGATWRARRVLGLKAQSERFVGATRIFMADVLPVAANTNTAYSFLQYRNTSPRDFADRFQSERLNDGGGYDLTARLTPLLFPSKRSTLDDFTNVASASFVWDVTGPNVNLGIYEIWAVDRDARVAAEVNATVGKGGNTNATHIYPRSIPEGGNIPAHMANLVKIRVRQGAGKGEAVANPTAFASKVAKTNTSAAVASAADNRRRLTRR